MKMDPFDQISAQILEEERMLRAMTEEQVRVYRRVLREILLHLSPETVEKWKRENPTKPWNPAPEEWERLILEAAKPKRGWGIGEDARKLAEENRALKAELAAVRRELAALRVQLAAEKQEPKEERPQPFTPAKEISIPPMPPARYRALFRNWQREGLALAVMASTGWSMRLAVAEVLTGRDGSLKTARSGSLKRMFEAMEKSGVLVGHVGQVGSARVAVVTLTDEGKAVARAMGIEPVESEWERLMRLHGGEAQAKHAVMVCVFTYQARKRGWSTHVCPDVAGPADPDVLVEKDGEKIYVEVEGESGGEERRMKKWRNMADFQGFVALAAVNEAMRERLVGEAKGASKRGMATDIQYLIRNPDGDLWAERW